MQDNRLLTLHHELLYPAFLGAALFEFARRFIPGVEHFDISWFQQNLLWIATSLWFVIYFSVAFLSLAKTASTPDLASKFGLPSFFANLIEISLIVGISGLIIESHGLSDNAAHGLSDKAAAAAAEPKLNYFFIFLGWILIPFTGGISNWFSGRHVRWLISFPAIAIGVVGMAWGYANRWDIDCGYLLSLVFAYGLLFAYCVSVAKNP